MQIIEKIENQSMSKMAASDSSLKGEYDKLGYICI
jgi:hypothetical protein